MDKVPDQVAVEEDQQDTDQPDQQGDSKGVEYRKIIIDWMKNHYGNA